MDLSAWETTAAVGKTYGHGSEQPGTNLAVSSQHPFRRSAKRRIDHRYSRSDESSAQARVKNLHTSAQNA